MISVSIIHEQTFQFQDFVAYVILHSLLVRNTLARILNVINV